MENFGGIFPKRLAMKKYVDLKKKIVQDVPHVLLCAHVLQFK